MKLSFHSKHSLNYLIIDDFFSEEELLLVKKEIIDLRRFSQAPDRTNTAIDNGRVLKNGRGVFLDGLYGDDRDRSDILTYMKKVFSDEVRSFLIPKDASFNHLAKSSIDTTLLNFYVGEGCYEAHYDVSVLTALGLFRFGEFTGGDVLFPDFEEQIKCVDNRLILFHGCTLHATIPVSAKSTDAMRASLAKFITYR